MPERFPLVRNVRETFVAKNLRMHAGNQHLIIIRTVENADAVAFQQITGGAPEKKIVLQLGVTGMFEAEHLTALRIDPGHDVPDGAVLSRRVYCLQDQQDGMTMGCIKQLLLGAQLGEMSRQQLLVLRF